jgi:hypothetical protein
MILVQATLGGTFQMASAAEYREYAKACLDLASKAENPSDKACLLHMAQSWHELARHIEDENGPTIEEDDPS